MQNKEAIVDALRDLCVPPHLKGYQYLIAAIEICMADNRLLKRVTTELYPSIAKTFEDRAIRVERVIRTAVEDSWNRAGKAALKEYFGGFLKKPSNSEFIAAIVFRLQVKADRYADKR